MLRKLIPDVVQSQDVVCLGPEATAQQAAQMMRDRHVGAIMVTENGQLKGIFTERDLTTRVIAQRLNPASTPLADVMTPSPVVLTPDASVFTALELMQSRKFRHLPLVENGRVVGMVSIRDLFGVVKAELQQELKETEAFLYSSGYSASVQAQRPEYGGWAQ